MPRFRINFDVNKQGKIAEHWEEKETEEQEEEQVGWRRDTDTLVYPPNPSLLPQDCPV